MSAIPAFTPAQLFAEIGSCQFEDYDTFESTLAQHFHAHALAFPVGYRLRDAVDWALRRDVIRREGGLIRVAPMTFE
jgi:hypothetical protein